MIYLNPGKVWCLAVTRGRVGRASHKFTLSYHLIANCSAAQALSREPGRSAEIWPSRNGALELSITVEQKYIRRCASSSLKNKISSDDTRRDCGSVWIIYTLHSLFYAHINENIYMLRSLFYAHILIKAYIIYENEIIIKLLIDLLSI